MMSQAAASSPLNSPRFYALDGLRAAALLCVVVFHSALSYVTVPLRGAWPIQDSQTHFIFDLLTLGLHQFQIPLFFVIAGFFGALLYERRGLKGFVFNRWKRIALPLLVGWIVLFPLTRIATLSANSAFHMPPEKSEIDLIHLWFLYQLLGFYGLFAAVSSTKKTAFALKISEKFFGRLLCARWRLLIFALPTALALFFSKGGVLETSTAFLPLAHVLLAHATTFAFGWLLYANRDALTMAFARRPWLNITAAMLLFPIYLMALLRQSSDIVFRDKLTQPYSIIAIVAGGLIAWNMIFGLLGLGLRHSNRPSKTIRYLSDSSYWIYLVHLPLTIWLPGVLASSAFAGAAAPFKFVFVLGVTLTIALLTYHFAVRATVVGRFLNGKNSSVADGTVS